MDVELPYDANGRVLRQMRESGDDLTKPREINFHFLFPTRSHAIGFIERVSDKSLTLRICWHEERGLWECTATRYMVPLHSEITALEAELSDLAGPLEGSPDGWGCFQVS